MKQQTLLFTYSLLTTSKHFHNKPALPANDIMAEPRESIAKTIRLARDRSSPNQHYTKTLKEKL